MIETLVRCRLGFIQYDRWLAGAPVPGLEEFKAAGFGYDGLDINYPRIAPTQPSMWEMKRIRLHNLQTFSFALPSAEALKAIARLSPIVEVGAGTGCWAKLLEKFGADVIATDAKDQSATTYVQRAVLGQYFPIVRAAAQEAVMQYRGRNVLVVWPCQNNPWMRQAAEAMRPGASLILIHAGRGGVVGDDGLFDCLAEKFNLETEIQIPRWPGIQDRLGIWRRRFS